MLVDHDAEGVRDLCLHAVLYVLHGSLIRSNMNNQSLSALSSLERGKAICETGHLNKTF